MALSEPKPKKNCKMSPLQPLPVHFEKSHRFKGTFNGFCVVIDDDNDMKKLVSMGCFGKSTMSRTWPEFQKHNLIRERVFENRKRNSGNDKVKCKVIVLPDSDSDSEDISEYFTNLKPEYQLDCSGVAETVNLGLEEAFFLAAAINCLEIKYDDKFLTIEEVWELFTQIDKYFTTNYVVYYYFRSKNWVVKNGIQFGGDFLLYKQGPAFFHASYVVIIHVVDETSKGIKDLSRRSMKYTSLMGLNRLCETAGKELLICEVIWPSGLERNRISFEDVPKFVIKEIVMKRWVSSQERQSDED